MSWSRIEDATWELVAELLPKPWPEEACWQDLRWWYNQKHQQEAELPGRRFLAKRWGITTWQARQRIEVRDKWVDPFWATPTLRPAINGTTSPIQEIPPASPPRAPANSANRPAINGTTSPIQEIPPASPPRAPANSANRPHSAHTPPANQRNKADYLSDSAHTPPTLRPPVSENVRITEVTEGSTQLQLNKTDLKTHPTRSRHSGVCVDLSMAESLVRAWLRWAGKPDRAIWRKEVRYAADLLRQWGEKEAFEGVFQVTASKRQQLQNTFSFCGMKTFLREFRPPAPTAPIPDPDAACADLLAQLEPVSTVPPQELPPVPAALAGRVVGTITAPHQAQLALGFSPPSPEPGEAPPLTSEAARKPFQALLDRLLDLPVPSLPGAARLRWQVEKQDLQWRLAQLAAGELAFDEEEAQLSAAVAQLSAAVAQPVEKRARKAG